MEDLSISDIMANLKSAFRERDFRDAELALIRREQQLRVEKLEAESKYKGVAQEKSILQKQYDELGREREEEVNRRIELDEKCRVCEKELDGLRERIARLEEEKVPAGRARTGRVEKERLLEKVGCLEKEKRKIGRKAATAERKEREGREENARLLEKIKGMEEEKREAERREREGREKNRRLLEKIKGMEEEKGKAERKEREVRGEIEKHLQKIECLEKEKERVLAEVESYKKVFIRLRERVDTLTMNLGSGDAQDMEKDRLDTNEKEKPNRRHSTHLAKLVGLSTNLSPPVGDKPAATAVIDIIDSDNDDEGAHPPDGLKRKRDSTANPSFVVVDNVGDAIFTRGRKSQPASGLACGPVRHSPSAVASGNGLSASRSITAPKCHDEKLAADSSWQFEADMLNAFDEDPVLTMEAVCALYRQHKSSGNLTSGSAFSKRGGFNGRNALRGTTLAEFLLDGNPQGSMKKSLKELQRHDPKGLDDCKKIASTHSRQLFEIYQRKEDPFFGPI